MAETPIAVLMGQKRPLLLFISNYYQTARLTVASGWRQLRGLRCYGEDMGRNWLCKKLPHASSGLSQVGKC